MSVNTNNYNYVAGYFSCANVGSKYTPFGTSYTDNASWLVEFESVKLSGAGVLAEHVDSDTDGWRVGINSSKHPYVYWSRNSSYRGTYTFTSLTLSWDAWYPIKFEIQTNSANPIIKCTLNGTSDTVEAQGRWNNNYNRDLQVGDTTTTIRGVVTVSGYAYGSNVLNTATFNMDSLGVGTTSTIVNSNTFSISSGVQNHKTEYAITYNANGGSGTVSGQTKVYGTNLTLRSSGYTRTGYRLTKWNTASNGGGTDYALGGTYSTNAAATMYAMWTANTYSVAFNANGGSGTMANESFTYGEAKALTSNAFTRSGYTFAGWATSAGGSVVYTDGQSVSNLTSTNNGTVNLYAKWTENTYTVSYNKNGGTGTISSQTKYGGSNLTLASSGFTKTGYQLSKWNTASGGTGTDYALGGTYSTNAAATMYAQWTANTYSVKFNANGGSGSMSNESFTYDEAKTLTNNAFTRDGYSFAGWATSASGAVVYANKESVSNLTSTNGATVNLYAKWTAQTYTIKYNANGGSGTIANGTKTGGTNFILPTGGFTKTGYHMSAWNLNGTGGSQYALGGTYTTNAAATFYAKWAANSYKVKFDANGGSGSMSDESFTYDQSKALTTNTFTRGGYEFLGWATSAGGAVVYSDGQSVSNLTSTDNGTVTLYAKWNVVGIEVKYNGNWVYGQVYVKRNGSWVTGQVYVKDNGTWKEGQ